MATGNGHAVKIPGLAKYRWLYGSSAAVVLFAVALIVGTLHQTAWQTLSVIGTSVLLEAQPAAVASVALGFGPITGAAVSILANLMLIPLLILGFDKIVSRWHWARHKVEKAKRWAKKYGRYGVGVLAVLSPFLGAYLCIAIGIGTGWKPLPTFLATFTGMLASVFLLTYGGAWVVSLFTHPFALAILLFRAVHL